MFNGFFKNDDHLIGRFGAAEKRKLPDAELSVRENPDMDKGERCTWCSHYTPKITGAQEHLGRKI